MKTAYKRTKIVCTIGPATEALRTMVALGQAGMDVARMNFSHGTYESHGTLLKRLRQAGRQLERPFGILQDLQGPKIRVGDLPKEGIVLQPGKEVIFTTSATPVSGDIPVTLPQLHRDAKRGARFLLDDGLLECMVRRVDGHRIRCEVIHGGKLTSHKGLNLPGTKLKIPALSDKDRADAAWGIKQGVDFIAMSFVRSAADVRDLRAILNRSANGKKIQVIGKIEKQEAVDAFDEILPLLDVVMVARGDLGIETDAAAVPVVQKQLIARCRAAGKPVIVATQMLDSMQRNPRPTRAEVSDIANAVADHADAVMLSGETASGEYPVEAVRVMSETIRATEGSHFDDLNHVNVTTPRDLPEVIGATVRVLVEALSRPPVVIATASGRTAREVSCYRPETSIHAFTFDEHVARTMRLLWGIEPHFINRKASPDLMVDAAILQLKKERTLKAGQRIIIVTGSAKATPGSANRVEIRNV